MRSTDKKLTDTVMKDGKYRITILSPHKLTFGGGVERFILNIVQNAPVDNFDIVVVQTDFIGEVVDVTGHLGGFNFQQAMPLKSIWNLPLVFR